MPSDFAGFNPMFPARTWRLKMRSMFSQFGDMFSEFGKNIAPTYYHDRCERSVQMRLYTMHKREFVLIFSAFFASFGLFLFIGLAGPPITNTVTVNATNLTPKLNKSQMATGPFLLRTPALSTFNQQLWVIARIIIKQGDDVADAQGFLFGAQMVIFSGMATQYTKSCSCVIKDLRY